MFRADRVIVANYQITLLSRSTFQNFLQFALRRINTAISRKVVGKNVHATIPKGDMGYDEYTVPDTVAVELTFVAFL